MSARANTPLPWTPERRTWMRRPAAGGRVMVGKRLAVFGIFGYIELHGCARARACARAKRIVGRPCERSAVPREHMSKDTDHCREAVRGAGHRPCADASAASSTSTTNISRATTTSSRRAVGHLLEIKAPEEYDVKRGKWSFANLPVIPPHFDLKPIDKTESRLNAARQADQAQGRRRELINACDAGREGELIFRLIAQHAQGASSRCKRLWLQIDDAAGDPRRLRPAAHRRARCCRWPTPRAAAPRPTGWSASTARAR